MSEHDKERHTPERIAELQDTERRLAALVETLKTRVSSWGYGTRKGECRRVIEAILAAHDDNETIMEACKCGAPGRSVGYQSAGACRGFAICGECIKVRTPTIEIGSSGLHSVFAAWNDMMRKYHADNANRADAHAAHAAPKYLFISTPIRARKSWAQEAYMRYHHMRQDHKAKGSDHE